LSPFGIVLAIGGADTDREEIDGGDRTRKGMFIMMTHNRKTSFLFAENTPYIEAMYEAYLTDSHSVSAQWQEYFSALQTLPAGDGSTSTDVAHKLVIDRFAAMAKQALPAGRAGLASVRKHIAVHGLVAAYRQLGARQANLDPLRWSPAPPLTELTPAFHGLGEADMNTSFSTDGTYFSDAASMTLEDLTTALGETYCGTLAAEFMHLTDGAQRQWWQMRLESSRARVRLSGEQRRRILERLTAAEGLERFLHNRYVGQKRFSLEGGESLIVLLDEAIRHGAAHGLKSVVLGMAHRGRLNVLANTVGKPARDVFDEFDGKTARRLPATSSTTRATAAPPTRPMARWRSCCRSILRTWNSSIRWCRASPKRAPNCWASTGKRPCCRSRSMATSQCRARASSWKR
jgi:2-oxoglutarate dehydrogenase E1 component